MSQGLPAAGSVLQRSVAAPGNQPQPQSPEDDDRKVRRREKNRVAAQRSRKKQTQKADKLHEAQGESSAAWAQHRRGHCHTFALGMVSRTMHCILGATFSEIFW
nr:basic leucine zipper transcriptional factor ATF-like 3 isoform X5 [Gorilla gorilla gorilla]